MNTKLRDRKNVSGKYIQTLFLSNKSSPDFFLILGHFIPFIRINLVGFEALTAVSTEMVVFWVVAPRSRVEVYQYFRDPCCLYHQGRLHSATTQKTAIFILIYLTEFSNRYTACADFT
jgi:hypothetical protein